ncbi:hypothetical protein FRC03_010650 [Tulasnella sp. 419]|nr:hypothetical protein FRC03_010650 [Tulasnella sp. 419]
MVAYKSVPKLSEHLDGAEATSQMQKRISREREAWQGLQHPNIAQLIGIVEKPRPGLVSLWYANGTIERYMRRRDSPDRLGLMLGCASGIEYLHGEQVIHGDIRPVNILIDDSENPVITDFGSTSYDEDEIAPDDFTPSRLPTEPRYMAIERTKFANLPSYPSDVYSFGCLILFMATSRHPFHRSRG